MKGRSHLRQMRFVETHEIVHHTWFAYTETFCGRPRKHTGWCFATSAVTCLVCVALMQELETAWRTLDADVERSSWRLTLSEEVFLVRLARGERNP